jgi:hypothetical protein
MRMNINDNDFFSALKTVFSVLPTLFTSDVFVAITDKEKFILIKQGQTFQLKLSEGMPLVKGGVSEKAIKTMQRNSLHYAEEVFGFPVIAYGNPIINPSTNNVVGTIIYAFSIEKEKK